jgi:hypothetical protein
MVFFFTFVLVVIYLTKKIGRLWEGEGLVGWVKMGEAGL